MDVDNDNMIHEARLPSFYNYNHEMYNELYGGGENVNPDYGFKYNDKGFYDPLANRVKEFMPSGELRNMIDWRKIIVLKFSTFIRALVQEAKSKGIEINNPGSFILKAKEEFANYFPNDNLEKYALETLERNIDRHYQYWQDLVVDERDQIYDYRPDSWSSTDTTIFNTHPGPATNFFKAEEPKQPRNVDLDRMSIPENYIEDNISLGYN